MSIIDFDFFTQSHLYRDLVAAWQENQSQLLVDQITGDIADQTSGIESSGPGRPGTALVSTDEAGFVRYFVPQSSWEVGTKDWSISFWVNPEISPTGVRYLFSSQGATGGNPGISIRHEINEDIRVVMGDGSQTEFFFTGDLKVNVGSWNHVLVTCDRDSATGLKLYINGVQHSQSKDPTARSGSLNTGAQNWYFHGNFQGSTSNYMLYHRALEAWEAPLLHTGLSATGIQYPFGDPDAQLVITP